MHAAHGVENRTIVTTMCRNGTEFGIRVSHMEGFQWITGPAQQVMGPMFAGQQPEDSGLGIGDSSITETFGIGGFAMAAALAISPLVGGTKDAGIGMVGAGVVNPPFEVFEKAIVKLAASMN